MNPAPNLILVGPMGAGKTSIGRRLAERFGLAFVDADQAIVDDVGSSIPAIFENVGEVGFRAHEKRVLSRLLDGSGQLISTGGGCVLDPDNRASEKVAERLGSSNRGPGRIPPPFEHHVVNLWGQTRDEWRVNRKTLGI